MVAAIILSSDGAHGLRLGVVPKQLPGRDSTSRLQSGKCEQGVPDSWPGGATAHSTTEAVGGYQPGRTNLVDARHGF